MIYLIPILFALTGCALTPDALVKEKLVVIPSEPVSVDLGPPVPVPKQPIFAIDTLPKGLPAAGQIPHLIRSDKQREEYESGLRKTIKALREQVTKCRKVCQ